MYREVDAQYRTTYHRQDTSNDCGEACGQTVLHSFTKDLYSQVDLRPYLATTKCKPPDASWKTGWGTNPHCITEKFQNMPRRNGDTSRHFNLVVCKSEEAVSRWLVYDIFSGGVAPCVVVNGMDHWVTVYACDVDKEPGKIDIEGRRGEKTYTPYEDPNDANSYQIKAFYVHDPAPNPMLIEAGRLVTAATYNHCVPVDPPSGGDPCATGDHCGTGVLDRETWGLAYRRITYAYWRSMVLTGIPNNPKVHWHGRFLAVVDAAEPFLQGNCPPWDPKKFKPVTPITCTGNFLGEAKASKAALDGLVAEGFCVDANGQYRADAPAMWRALLRGTQPGTVRCVTPAVSHIQNFTYYLVDMVVTNDTEDPTRNGWTPVVVMVNACKEEILEFAGIRNPLGNTAVTFIQVEDMIKAVIDRNVTFGDIGVLRVQASDVTRAEDVKIVWTPARDSLSPYYPFYQFEIQGRQLYVRVDFQGWFDLLQPENEPVDLSYFTEIYSEHK